MAALLLGGYYVVSRSGGGSSRRPSDPERDGSGTDGDRAGDEADSLRERDSRPS